MILTKVFSYKKPFDASTDIQLDLFKELLVQVSPSSFSLDDPVEGITKSLLKRRNNVKEYEEHFSYLYIGDPMHKRVNLGCQPSDPIEGELAQIFIKSLTGKSLSVRIEIWEQVQVLQQKIHEQIGIPKLFQNLIYAGKSLQEGVKLQEYHIGIHSTIILNLRLLGGSLRHNSKGPASFKDAIKRKEEPQPMKNNVPIYLVPILWIK